MNLDLRNSSADSSQRMLNAIESGSVVPIHRHQKTSETVVVLRGRVVEGIILRQGFSRLRMSLRRAVLFSR